MALTKGERVLLTLLIGFVCAWVYVLVQTLEKEAPKVVEEVVEVAEEAPDPSLLSLGSYEPNALHLSSGSSTITIEGERLEPEIANYTDLGSAVHPIKDIYLSGNIIMVEE